MALSIAGDWRSADLDPRLQGLLGYAEKLALSPAAMTADDLKPMREAGLSDEAILHACEVVSYFSFVNRMADGLGVALEPGWSEPIIPFGGEPAV